MIDDPIVAEVRRAREAYAEKFNFDLWAMYEDLKRREKESNWPIVDLSERRSAAAQDAPASVPISGPGGTPRE